jgi:hypothetical protein
MQFLLVIAGTLALAGAGCGASGERADAEKAPTQRDEREAISLDERPATPEEVRWVGRLIDWAGVIEQPIEVVATVTTEGASPQGDARRRLEEALATIAACETSFVDRVGEPPSERLEVVEANVDDACEHYAAGASAAERLLAGDGDGDVLADEWEGDWAAAAELMTSVAQQVGDYQPGNARDLPVRKGVTAESRVEATFSRVASKLIDREVEVRCWSERDWGPLVREAARFSNGRIPPETPGFITGFEDRRVNLHPEVCESLVALSYQGIRPQGDDAEAAVALAVGTLAHEAQHVRGVVDEASAECLGMQMIRKAARELGAPLGYPRRLAQTYSQAIHPMLPPAYRSPDCYDGGRLDSDPESAVWP